MIVYLYIKQQTFALSRKHLQYDTYWGGLFAERTSNISCY